jgi:hypothetical protein
MASNNKSSWSIRPASPDSLSKKLKKCKSRKERQDVFLLDQIEREERRRAEQAQELAVKKAAEEAAYREMAAKFPVDKLEEGLREATGTQQVVRPLKERLQRAVLVKPEPPKEPVNLARRYGVDPKHFNITRHEGGQVRVSAIKMNPLIPAVVTDNGFMMTERYALYLELQKMNLRDPATVEKVRQACASPQKAEEKREDLPQIPKTPKKKLFKN